MVFLLFYWILIGFMIFFIFHFFVARRGSALGGGCPQTLSQKKKTAKKAGAF